MCIGRLGVCGTGIMTNGPNVCQLCQREEKREHAASPMNFKEGGGGEFTLSTSSFCAASLLP